jgi:transcriptional regulator with AAA-type ATPase domain
MSLLAEHERRLLEAVSGIVYANPFLPALAEQEHRALGPAFVAGPEHWSMTVADPRAPRKNTGLIQERVEALLDRLRQRLLEGRRFRRDELALYEDAVLFHLYFRFNDRINTLTTSASEPRWDFYRDFLDDWKRLFDIPGVAWPTSHTPAHTFACYYQIARAFHHIYDHIIGGSAPAARLRASTWQSIFTHDIRRYRRTLYDKMGDFATLITGPSGTGKELVARAIALSRYVPFNERVLRFSADLDGAFHALNIAALPDTLVESELFGHRKGAFTGAASDKRGWLDSCPGLGAVFLDEIGELNVDIQVKLLRVIETRTFQALGETKPRRFAGKLIAATNRDLPARIAAREFREDLYYRLCSDQIHTPSLRQQLDESPEVLGDLVLFLARRVAGDEADNLATEAMEWIRKNLGSGYTWPGNYRELEQCLRNLLIRRDYQPPPLQPAASDDPFADARAGRLTAEEFLNRYCRLVYSQTGSYEETGRRLGLDRRTVKRRVETE